MSDKPNILFIFTDQQRADTIAALGNPIIKTPNLDRLVAEGVAFTNAFTPSPVCVSARCSMIFGQYPHHTGCYDNSDMPTDGRESYMDALNNAGYYTHGIGKCHFTPDRHALRGFQSRETQEEVPRQVDEDDYLTYLHKQGFEHVCDPHGIRSSLYYVPQPSQIAAEHHPSQWIGDRSIDFINKRAESDEPWHLFTSFIDPHPPFAPPNPWHYLYEMLDVDLPKVPQDWESLLIYINREQNRKKHRGHGIDLDLVRCIKAYYYATISFVDYQVGRILKSLEETGQLDNTFIVFTADHGELLGDYNSFGKRSMHDAAANIPFLVRYPQALPANEICTTPVSLIDLAPTFLSLADANISSHSLDGENLFDIFNKTSDRDMVISHFDQKDYGVYMAVTEAAKYFYSAPDDMEFYFDRKRDPSESRNRANVRFYDVKSDALRDRLIDVFKEANYTDPLEGDEWKKFPYRDVSKNPDVGFSIARHPWADYHVPGYTDLD